VISARPFTFSERSEGEADGGGVGPSTREGIAGISSKAGTFG